MNPKTFSHRINVSNLSAKPIHATLTADERERAWLAERWGVLSVDAVSADLELSRWKRDGVRVKGIIGAEITQECVVTLDPISETLSEEIEALYVPEGSKLARVQTSDIGEMVIEAEGPDAPEVFVGDSIDIAQIYEEFIVLAIDPYPRKEGAELPPGEPEIETDPAESPFAGLSELSRKQ